MHDKKKSGYRARAGLAGLAAVLLCSAGCRSASVAAASRAASATAVKAVDPLADDGEKAAADSVGGELADMLVLTEALMLAKRSHVEEHSFRDLIYAATDGMLQSLDPYSSFLASASLESLEEETSGHFGGVGLSVGASPDGARVLAPIDGSPAFRAGIRAGDTITAIDGKPLRGLPIHKVIKIMRGEKGSEVQVTVRRASGEEVRLPLVRDEIKITCVDRVGKLGGGIGYARITRFSESTPEDFARALRSLMDSGAKGLVLDLRDNPGGLLESAVGVADLLLPKGAEIVSVKGRQNDGKPDHFSAGAGETHETELPLAVLINKNSASASEVLAGALKAHKRAVIVGERSYGKASVQSVIRLKFHPECAVRLTTAYYYTPDGKLIHGRGIEPDVEVPMPNAERREARRRRMTGETSGAKPRPGADLNPKDPQLARACELLQGTFHSDSGQE